LGVAVSVEGWLRIGLPLLAAVIGGAGSVTGYEALRAPSQPQEVVDVHVQTIERIAGKLARSKERTKKARAELRACRESQGGGPLSPAAPAS